MSLVWVIWWSRNQWQRNDENVKTSHSISGPVTQSEAMTWNGIVSHSFGPNRKVGEWRRWWEWEVWVEVLGRKVEGDEGGGGRSRWEVMMEGGVGMVMGRIGGGVVNQYYSMILLTLSIVMGRKQWWWWLHHDIETMWEDDYMILWPEKWSDQWWWRYRKW